MRDALNPEFQGPGTDLDYPLAVLQQDEQLGDECVQVGGQQVLVAVLAEVYNRGAGVRLRTQETRVTRRGRQIT